MLEQALRFGQILASADFSPSDTAALRAGLITYFQKEPAKQMRAYESVAKILQQQGNKPSWLGLAILRYNQWQRYSDPRQLREFESYPFGRMVLKYDPIVASSGGMIVTKNDVDCQFYSDTMIATAAGVVPPTETGKDQFVRHLQSRFASMPAEQKQYLREAEIRLALLHIVYDGTVKTHAAVLADIRKNVHSSTDVEREARQVETQSDSGVIAQQRAADFLSRLAVSQMQFQMKMEAARAEYDAALAMDPRMRWVPDPSRNDDRWGDAYSHLINAARIQHSGYGAAGKYWQSYVKESNGARANDDIVTLAGLMKRNSAPRSSSK